MWRVVCCYVGLILKYEIDNVNGIKNISIVDCKVYNERLFARGLKSVLIC